MTVLDALPAPTPHRPAVRGGKRRSGSRRGRAGHRRDFQRTVVLIPAHNEQEQIEAAIESVLNQTYRPKDTRLNNSVI